MVMRGVESIPSDTWWIFKTPNQKRLNAMTLTFTSQEDTMLDQNGCKLYTHGVQPVLIKVYLMIISTLTYAPNDICHFPVIQG